jgi:DNA-directed RNA polymerase I and III subunit RPAC1
MRRLSRYISISVQVPTVAVENVYVWNNTSIVQDEVLAQRLGLVALNIDPTKVEFKQREGGSDSCIPSFCRA